MDATTKEVLGTIYKATLGEFCAVIGTRGAVTIVDKEGTKVSDKVLANKIALYNKARRERGLEDRHTVVSFKEELRKRAETEAKEIRKAKDKLRNDANNYLKELGIIDKVNVNIDMSAECSKDTLVCDALEYMDYTPNDADYKLFNGKIALTTLPDGNTALVIYTGQEVNTVKIIADDDSIGKYKDNIRKVLNTVKSHNGATLLSTIRSTLTDILQDAGKAFMDITDNDFDERIKDIEKNDELDDTFKANVLSAIDALKQKTINDRMQLLLQSAYPKVVATAYMQNAKGISVLNDITNTENSIKKSFHGFAVPNVEDVITAARTCFGGLLKTIEYPKIFTNDATEPCLNYFDLNTVRVCSGTCEVWDEFFRLRVTPEETNVIKAYLWACVYAKNRSRQILFIWDDGHSGKSTIINVLSKYFGSMAAAAQKDSFNNQFSIAKYWDKHVILFGDTGNSRLHTMDKVKSITGGDDMEVEQKGRNSFKANVYAHIIAASNTPLVIDENERCETSRLIPIKFNLNRENALKTGAFVEGVDGKLKPVGDAEFEGKLLNQLPAFLKTCEKEYVKLCPKDADIVLPPVIEERFKTSYGKLSIDESDMLAEILREAGFTITDNENDVVSERTLYTSITSAGKSASMYACSRVAINDVKVLLRKRGILDTHTHTVNRIQRVTVDYYANIIQNKCSEQLTSNERAIIGSAIIARRLEGVTQEIVQMLTRNDCLNTFAELTETPINTLERFANSENGLGTACDFIAWCNTLDG